MRAVQSMRSWDVIGEGGLAAVAHAWNTLCAAGPSDELTKHPAARLLQDTPLVHCHFDGFVDAPIGEIDFDDLLRHMARGESVI